MNWILLIIAGLFEVGFTFCLGKAKESQGSEAIFWYIAFGVALVCSMGLLMKAVQTLPLGMAYAIWTGIGVTGTVLVGIFFFNDPASFWRLFFTFTLIVSIIGLKLVTN